MRAALPSAAADEGQKSSPLITAGPDLPPTSDVVCGRCEVGERERGRLASLLYPPIPPFDR